MATTTNYGWTTPDDTALVKDGAAAIRTLGSSVDTTTKALNPSTTLGDIEYRSSTANTNTRLGIGTSGQGLQVVAGVPSWAATSTSTLTTTGDLLYASAANTLARRAIGSTGDILTVSGGLPTWATPTATADNFSLLNTGGTSLSGSGTITVSGISGKSKIYVLIDSASSASASSTVRIRLNGDTGNNYNSDGISNTGASAYAASNFSANNEVSTTSFEFAKMSTVAGSEIHGGMLIQGCNSSGLKMINLAGGSVPSTGNSQIQYIKFGVYTGTSTISSVSVISDTGNFDAGKVYIYASA